MSALTPLPVAALRLALTLRRGLGADIRRARDAVCGTATSTDRDQRVKVALHQAWFPESWDDDLSLQRPSSRTGVRTQHLREADAIERWAMPQIPAHQRQDYRIRAAEVDAQADAAWRRRGEARRAACCGEVLAPLFFDTA